MIPEIGLAKGVPKVSIEALGWGHGRRMLIKKPTFLAVREMASSNRKGSSLMNDTHQKSDKKYADAVILTIMLSAVIINYFIYSKLAFLDFYFLLVVIAGYTLGKRFAVLGAFFTILMVWIFILANKGEYLNYSGINDIHLNLTVWGGFLVLAAWLIGSLSEKLKEELKESNRLRQDLDRERELLEVSNRRLSRYNQGLETTVAARTLELKRSNQDLMSFATIASHDLQEPLRKIVAFGDRLDKYLPADDPKPREYLKRMKKSASRMQGFIQGLLKLSSVTSKAKPFEPTDLEEILQAVVSDLEVRLEQTKGKVEFGFLPSLQADPLQIHQLFLNLIGNALKFHREGVPPVIRLSARPDGTGSWEISVEDNGIGIKLQHMDRIFNPFERFSEGGPTQGSGMGLAICQKIVTRHHGTISVFSGQGQGTTFQIILPEKQPLEDFHLTSVPGRSQTPDDEATSF